MTPNRSRTIAIAFATLILGTLAAGPALGALSASPNPSTTGNYTVSDASPPALSADEITGFRSTLYTYNLVETPTGGTAQSYGLGRGPVSRSFTGKSAGTYSYQLQTCEDVYELDGFDFVHISNVCTDSGSALTVTVGSAPTPDLMPDFGTASVTARSWTQNAAITSFTVPAATGGDTPLSYSASGLPAGVSMSSARLVSGTPTAAGSGTATVTVTDDDDDTDTLTFTWTVTAPTPVDLMPDFGTASVTAKSWTQNTAIASFTVPAATGGDTPLSYSATGLPAGVSMSSARLVSGTPTAAGSGTATITVTDDDDDTDTLTFTWTVAADLVPDFGTASVADQNWTLNRYISFVVIPAASGGDGTLTYSGSGLPAGIRFLTTTRTVLGRPTESGSGTFTVTVTDADGDTDTLSFDWTVVDPMPDFGTASVSDKTWTQNRAITSFNVPRASGGNTPLTYTASGLPAGVSMSSTRRVSGTPTAAGSGTVTVTVSDTDGDTDTLTFDWTVTAVPDFGTASVTAKSWKQNTAVTAFTVPAATGGDVPLSYTASGLPAGVSMSSDREVSGTPTAHGSGTATVTVTDDDGDTATLTFEWAVAEDLMPDYSGVTVSAKNWYRDETITAFTVDEAGGGDTPLSYTASGLPAGVSMSSARRVSGTPSATGSGTATVTATDSDGDTATLTFDWTVVPDLIPTFGTASVSAKHWLQSQAIPAFTVPVATGGNPPLSYTVSGLPSGVSMSSARRISGTPTATGSGTATVTVTDVDGDTDTISFNWTVVPPPSFGTVSVAAKSWKQNTAITSFTVPAATGGHGPLRYTASGLPVGLSMSGARRVSGTPTAAGSGSVTVTATDTGGNTATLTFDWTVAVDLMPDYSGVTVTAKRWTQNQSITAFTVPAATGGDTPLSYTASGLPSGVTMSSARQVSGTPTATGSGTATVTVRDNDGDETALSFAWTVVPPLDFGTASVAAKSWTQNTAITAFTVPAATGGHAPLSYSATGLPIGVSMSSARLISGTPTATGAGTATVTVTGDDGDTDTLSFTWTVIAVSVPNLIPDFGTASVPTKRWTQNVSITAFTVPAATGGDTPLSYSATGLPTGITMSSARVVSGTPTATGSGTATVTVTDNDGDTDTLTFTWTVTAPTTTGSLTASPNPSATGSYTVRHASPPALPVDTVTNALQYLNTYNLVETPSGGAAQSHGLGRGPVSKSFTGKSSGTYAYQLQTCVDTYDFDGSDFVHRSRVCTNSGSSLTVTVDRRPDYSGVTVPAQSWPRGQAIIAFTIPAASGDAPLAYSISGEPAGVSINSQTSELSGTPTTNGTGTATVTATDNDGDTDTLTFTWTVEADSDPTFPVDTLTARTWAEDVAIAAFTVPAATGGNVPLTFSISGEPDDIEFDPETRNVSGTPTATGSGTATVTVTDNDGDRDTLTFDWTVVTPPPVPGRPTGPDTDTDGAYAIAWTSTTGAIRYELQESFNGGAWTSVPTTGTATTKSFTGKASGEYLYRVRACNASVCSDWSPLKILFVNLPPTVGFDSTYVVRTGDLGSDGDTDVYLSPTATGTGNVGEFILENDSGTFTLDTSPTLTELAAAQSWTVSTQQSIVLEDVNVDGVWDAYVTGIEGNITDAVNQIVISPKTRSGLPTGLIAVDADLKDFFKAVKPWYDNLSHYDATILAGSHILENATNNQADYASYLATCQSVWGACITWNGTLTSFYGGLTECIAAIASVESMTSQTFTFEVNGQRRPRPLAQVCGLDWRAHFGVVLVARAGKDFSRVPLGAIEHVADFVKIWEAGDTRFEVEDLADVLETVMGIPIGIPIDLDLPDSVRVSEIHQALLNMLFVIYYNIDGGLTLKRQPDTVYVTRRRVGGLGWLLLPQNWHTALEYTHPLYSRLPNASNPTIAAYAENGKLVSKRNHRSERNNLPTGSVTSIRYPRSKQLWDALVEADQNYSTCLPLVNYDYPAIPTENEFNSNGYIAGIIDAVSAETSAPVGIYFLGSDPVPRSEFLECRYQDID